MLTAFKKSLWETAQALKFKENVSCALFVVDLQQAFSMQAFSLKGNRDSMKIKTEN